MDVQDRPRAVRAEQGRLAARVMASILLLVTVNLPRPAVGEEIRFVDNHQINAMIEAVSGDELRITTMEGETRTVPLRDILTITFRGREPRMLPAGTQELRFVNDDRLVGMLKGVRSDALALDTFTAGLYDVNIGNLKGFVTMPQMGRVGREAEELAESAPREGDARFLDAVLDRRGSRYDGTLRRVTAEAIEVDHDELLKDVSIPLLYLAGGRFADAERRPAPAFSTNVLLRVWTRDGSYLNGRLDRIDQERWLLKPAWDQAASLPVFAKEIASIQVLNARRMYLSQLTPIRVKESTHLAPPQPYRMDRSCQNDQLTIGRHAYPWGIGVHANSELTFRLSRTFKTFDAVLGVDSHSGDWGSVVFTVLGDGKTLYTSPVVRGSDAEPREVSVSVDGVDELTLKVEAADGRDFGDLANWAIAQVSR